MDYLAMLEAIDAKAEHLSSKEVDFVEDMLERLLSTAGDGSVSVSQRRWIEDLHERHVINRGVIL